MNNVRADRKQGLQIGEVVILDADYNNSSEVRILWLGKFYAIVEADGCKWTTMKYRLSKKIDVMTAQLLNSTPNPEVSDTTGDAM